MSPSRDRGGGYQGSKGPSPPPCSFTARPAFQVDEKVLCYEPDAKKARVLYDSKVLEVVKKRDVDGTFYEYKIHFQGWKDTWDRYVRESQVLKDTETNRELQRELNEAAQALIKSSKKTKRKKTIKEKLQAVQTGNLLTNDSLRIQPDAFPTSDEDTVIPVESGVDGQETDQPQTYYIVLPHTLRQYVDEDYHSITFLKRLAKLPSRITVVDILEDYLRQCAQREISKFVEKVRKHCDQTPRATVSTPATNVVPSTSAAPMNRTPHDVVNEFLMKTIQRISIRRRVIEDVRLLFDFMMERLLLYDEERSQYNKFVNGNIPLRHFSYEETVFHTFLLTNSTIEAYKRSRRDDVGSCKNVVTDHIISSYFSSTKCGDKEKKEHMPWIPSECPVKILEIGKGECLLAAEDLNGGHSEKERLRISKELADKYAMPPPPPPSKPPAAHGQVAPKPRRHSSRIRSSSSLTFLSPTKNFYSRLSGSHQELRNQHRKRRKNSSEHKLKSKQVVNDVSSQTAENLVAPSSSTEPSESSCKVEEECQFPWACRQLRRFLDELSVYHMVPTTEIDSTCYYPSLCYGMYHLLRLFVKLPEILARMTIPKKKLKAITEEVNVFLQYFANLDRFMFAEDWCDYEPEAPAPPRIDLKYVYEEDFINERTCHLFRNGDIPEVTTLAAEEELRRASRRAKRKAEKALKEETQRKKRALEEAVEEVAVPPLTTPLEIKLERLSPPPEELPSSRRSRRSSAAKAKVALLSSSINSRRSSYTPKRTAVVQSPESKPYSLRNLCKPSNKTKSL